MRTDGFVLCLTGKAFHSQKPPEVIHESSELGTAVGIGIKLFVATLANTPEDAVSAQPLLHQEFWLPLPGGSTIAMKLRKPWEILRCGTRPTAGSLPPPMSVGEAVCQPT